MKKNKILLTILLSAGFYSAAWADAYSNAYGKQAVMSPGGLPSTLSLNGGGMSSAPAQASYSPPSSGNGVYLGGPPQAMQMPAQPMSMMNMNAMPPNIPNTASYIAPQTNQYYSGSNFGQPQPMMPQPTPMMQGNYYSPSYQPPNIGAFATPPNTELVSTPAYGVRPQLVQRNSSNSSSPGLPYRAMPNMPLNPNSGMNMMNSNQQPKTNDQVMNILSGSNGQNASVMSILGASQPPQANAVQTSNNPNGASMWVRKVFTRPASHKVSGW